MGFQPVGSVCRMPTGWKPIVRVNSLPPPSDLSRTQAHSKTRSVRLYGTPRR
jgi:hypothetical protein